MKFGVIMFPTDDAISILSLAQLVESEGFESLWFPDHSHIPVSRTTPYPNGGELPDFYSRIFDPIVALASVAAVTKHLRLGTGVCLAMQRDPITLAKEVATLDRISEGRLLFGVGAGWNREEMTDHGTSPALRWNVLREKVLAMKEIWTNDVAEFHGEYVDFAPLWSWPKPVQRPHPPVLIGGNGSKALEALAEYGDEWLPGAGLGLQKVSTAIEDIRIGADSTGRSLPLVSIYAAAPDHETIAAYEGLGVSRCILWLPSVGEAVAEATVKAWSHLLRSFD